jgi:hypothetical protein
MWAVPWKGGRHGGKAEGRKVRNRPCDVAHRSEVCGTLEDLTVHVASSLLGMLYGARGALGPSWGRAWQHREVPCSRARVPVFVSENHRRMHRRRGCSKGAGSTGRGSSAWRVRMRRVDVIVRGRGHCGRYLRAPRAPPALECGSSGARACARGRGARRRPGRGGVGGAYVSRLPCRRARTY